MTEARFSSLMAQAAIALRDEQFADALGHGSAAVELARRSCGECSKELARALDLRSKVQKKRLFVDFRGMRELTGVQVPGGGRYAGQSGWACLVGPPSLYRERTPPPWGPRSR